MTASVLRAVEPAMDEILDRKDEILDRFPDLSKMDLPSLQLLGRRADEAVDRMRGRSRRPAWPWLLGGLVVVGVAIAAASAVMTWSRGRAETWPEAGEDDGMGEPNLIAGSDLPAPTSGLTTAEGPLPTYDPLEDRGA